MPLDPNKLAPTALPAVLDVADLARLLRLHVVTVRLKAASGEIPGGKQIGNRWRFSRAVIEAWLAGEKDDDKAA
jgi:excisionase family DNA binding protein